MFQIQLLCRRCTIYSISNCQILLCAFISKNHQLKMWKWYCDNPYLAKWINHSWGCGSVAHQSMLAVVIRGEFEYWQKNHCLSVHYFLGGNVNVISKEERLDNVALVGWMEESTTLPSLLDNMKRPVGDDDDAPVVPTSILLPSASMETFLKRTHLHDQTKFHLPSSVAYLLPPHTTCTFLWNTPLPHASHHLHHHSQQTAKKERRREKYGERYYERERVNRRYRSLGYWIR